MQLRNIVSILNFNRLLNFINSVNDKKVFKIQHTQNKKLFNIGLHHEVIRLNPKKLIFNYSDKILTPDEIETLSHFLKLALPPSRINYSRWFLTFEKLFLKLKYCKFFYTSNDGLNYIKSSLKSIAFKNYYSFRPRVNSLQKKFLATLKKLKSDLNIVVFKSDKGNAIVILNKQDYQSKMNNILNDTSKFKLITDNLFNVLITKGLKEDKINRLLSKLKKGKEICDCEFSEMYATGTLPGILYGLPKIHKNCTPLRPILSAIGNAGHKLAKFFAPLLVPFTTNQYSVRDSFSFVEEILSLKIRNSYIMASYDIKSIFTNMQETVKIASEKFFNSPQTTRKFTESWFRHFLTLATKDLIFLFNDKIYSQIEEFANLFISHHVLNWLENCPNHFNPKFYRRYADDTFILYSDASHVPLFLEYLNSQQPNIKFTHDLEKDGKLNFLDVTINPLMTNFLPLCTVNLLLLD